MNKRAATLEKDIHELHESVERLWTSFLYLVPDEYKGSLDQNDYLRIITYGDRDDAEMNRETLKSKKRAESAQELVQRIKNDRELVALREMKPNEAREYLLKKTQG